MGELEDFSREREDQSLVDSGILSGDDYKAQRAQINQFLESKITATPADPAREAQARTMAERAGIELSAVLPLYTFMRNLNIGFSDQVVFDEVLRLTKNEKRSDFRKSYPNIFPADEKEQSDHLQKAA